MKKTYIEPKTVCMAVKCEQLLQSVSGDGLHVGIDSAAAEFEAEARGDFWDDEE